MAEKNGCPRFALNLAACAIFIVSAVGWVAVAAAGADGTPSGMVAFFTSADCPSGWSTAGIAQGRAVVAVQLGSEVGKTTGAPLADKTAPTHGHAYKTDLDLPYKKVALASCSHGLTCGKSAAKAGSYTVGGNTDNATSGLPFIQLTVCQKQ